MDRLIRPSAQFLEDPFLARIGFEPPVYGEQSFTVEWVEHMAGDSFRRSVHDRVDEPRPVQTVAAESVQKFVHDSNRTGLIVDTPSRVYPHVAGHDFRATTGSGPLRKTPGSRFEWVVHGPFFTRQELHHDLTIGWPQGVRRWRFRGEAQLPGIRQ